MADYGEGTGLVATATGKNRFGASKALDDQQRMELSKKAVADPKMYALKQALKKRKDEKMGKMANGR